MQGDGDLPLARRQRPAAVAGGTPSGAAVAPPLAGAVPVLAGEARAPVQAGEARVPGGETAAGRPADEEAADDEAVSGLAREGTAGGGTSGGAPGPHTPAAGSGAYGARGRPGWPARRVVVAVCAVVAALAGGAVAGVLLSSNGPAGTGGGGGYTSRAAFSATAPWRLKVDGAGTTAGGGCDITVINAQTGAEVRHLNGSIDSTSTFVISDKGTFLWRVNDAKCVVVAQPGITAATLPFALNQYGLGDTGVFTAPAKVSVHVTYYQGSQSCSFALYNPATGTELDFGTITKGQTAGDTVTMESAGSKNAYVETDGCGFHVSAAS